MSILIKQANVVNEGKTQALDVLIKNGRIEKIASQVDLPSGAQEIRAEGLILMPGVIDDQVHFREPGLTHKADIGSEAKAAVAGGTTSFMEMPNTNPPALDMDRLEEKFAIGAQSSIANYSFYMGASNDNFEQAIRVNECKDKVAGLKIFMGSSTGNMLVDNYVTLDKLFGNSEVLIATHCEREEMVRENHAKIVAQYGEDIDASYHPIIRDEATCYESSYSAIQLAQKHNTRLHILHITTAKELQLFGNMIPLREKRITSEVCVHHLHFTADDYAEKGNLIKCNPAIKNPEHKDALWRALLDDTIDVIATDHAPHTWDEKAKRYIDAPSGLPLVQHGLLLMLDYVQEGRISLTHLVKKMCHDVADCYQVADRGYIREGYWADLVLIDPKNTTTVNKDNILYKCKWSPFEGHRFTHSIHTTFVNGVIAYTDGKISTDQRGQRILFSR